VSDPYGDQAIEQLAVHAERPHDDSEDEVDVLRHLLEIRAIVDDLSGRLPPVPEGDRESVLYRAFLVGTMDRVGRAINAYLDYLRDNRGEHARRRLALAIQERTDCLAVVTALVEIHRSAKDGRPAG
jgi:hypothetical protein